jgi:hypothetical protein
MESKDDREQLKRRNKMAARLRTLAIEVERGQISAVILGTYADGTMETSGYFDRLCASCCSSIVNAVFEQFLSRLAEEPETASCQTH